MRCIECEEIELARVRDERPGQTLPIPYAALDGFPAGRTAARPDAPAAAAVGRGRVRVDLRRQGARLRAGLGVGRATRRRRRSRRRWWCSISPAATTASTCSCRTMPPTTPSYQAARPSIHRAPAGRRPPTASARRRCPARAAPRSRSRTSTVSKNGGGDNSAARFNFTGTGGDGFGFDTLFGDGTGGAGLGPGDHARGRRQAVQPQPLRQLGHLVPGQQRPEHQDGLARPLARALRLGHESAAGDLDRHRALEVDPHDGQAGVRDPVAADGRVHDELEQLRRLERLQREPAGARPGAARHDAGQRLPASARARPTTSRSRPTSARAPPARVPPNTAYPNDGDAVDAAADRRAPAGGEPRHARSSRSTGARSTPTPASSPGRTASSPSSRARSAAFRPT